MNETSTTERIAPRAAPLIRYLKEEGLRRREALRSQAKTEIETIQAEGEARKKQIISAAQADQAALMHGIMASVLGRATAEAEVITLRKMGDAVSQIIVRCREKCRQFAQSEAFRPVLEALLLEAVEQARELRPEDTSGTLLGDLLVAPTDASFCAELIRKHGLKLDLKPAPDVCGGIEILVADTTYRIRNTLLSRMEKLDASLRHRATALLTARLAKEAVE